MKLEENESAGDIGTGLWKLLPTRFEWRQQHSKKVHV